MIVSLLLRMFGILFIVIVLSYLLFCRNVIMHVLHFSPIINIFSVVYMPCTNMQYRERDIFCEYSTEEFQCCVD